MNRFYANDDSNREMRLYLKEISRIPLLTREEEQELGYRAQRGDKEALQKMVESNLRFVIKIAKKYRNSGLSFLDLINQGNVGLIVAARRFDPDRRVRFTSYAIWWIRQSILQYLSEAGHIFRISPKMANVLYRVSKVLACMRSEREETLSSETLAREAGVTLEELNASTAARGATLSLDHSPDGSGPSVLVDVLEQRTIRSAEEGVITANLKKQINRSLSTLKPQEELVLRLRFGLENDSPLSLKQIGDRMSLSRERIRQIEAKALDKLRKTPTASSLATFLN